MQIQSLKLFTPNLNKQRDFYTKTLGFTLTEETDHTFSIKIGSSELTFETKEHATPYHFAINIPNNKINEAVDWIKSKNIEILPFDGEEIVDFSNISAYSTYFYDEDKNIVEFIARKNLNNHSKEPFEIQSLIELSEIGLPTKDIPAMFNELKDKLDLPIFSGNTKRFAMIGNEQGMFLCINTDIKDYWVPTSDKINHSSFEITIEDTKLLYQDNKIIFL